MPLAGSSASGAKVPTPKPPKPANVHTGANPRGIAIATPKPPRILTTGATPRGTQIVAKNPTYGNDAAAKSAAKTSRILTTGANPRGTAISLPKKSAKARATTATNDRAANIGYAAIRGPKISGLGKFVEHGFEDVPLAVKGTVIGAEALGKGVAQSVGQGSLTPLGHVLHGMWHNSIPQLLLEGAFQHPFDKKGEAIGRQIEQDFYQHPLLSTMQVVPVGKLADLGGAASRLTRAGAAAGRAADEAHVLLPRATASGSDIATLHPSNLVAKALPRVAADNLRAAITGNKDHATTLAHKAIDTRLNEMVDNLAGTHSRRIRTALEENSHRLKQTLKHTDPLVKHNLTRAVIGEARTPETARSDLNALSGRLREARDKIASGEWTAGGVTKKAALKAIDAQHMQLEKLLDSPRFNEHIATIFKLKPQIVEHINSISQQMLDHGLLAEHQAERRALLPYAISHMPGVRRGTIKDKIPQHDEALRANKAVRQAAKNFQAAAERYHRVMGLRGRGSRLETDVLVKEARQRLNNAKRAEANRRNFIQGRVGATTPLRPGQYLKLDKAIRLTHQRQDELAQVLAEHHGTKAIVQEQAKEGLLAATKTLEDAKKTAAALKEFQGQSYADQFVIDDGAGSVRPLTNEEIKQHMAENGVNPLAYVSGKLPAESRTVMSRLKLSRGDAPGAKFTGGSLAGLWDSSAEGLHNSIMQSVLKIEHAKSHDLLMRRIAVARDLLPAEADAVKQSYEEATGVPLEAVNQHSARLSNEQWDKVHQLQGPEEDQFNHALIKNLEINGETMGPDARVALVPKTALDRVRAHAEADSAAPMIQHLNRAFRNAVLPFSPKWITGNVVEAAVRSALAGVRPGDAKLFKEVMATIPKDQRDEFLAQSGVSSGTHFGFGDERNFMGSLRPEMAGNDGLAEAIRRSGKRISSYYTGIRNGIYHLNKSAEIHFERGVAGAQFRQWAKTWEDTTRKQEDYLQALGRHVATPQMAEETSRAIHDVLGKYNDFSPAMKRVINTVAPFGPWYLNAVKFVTYTLPVEHPLVNAALTATGAHEQNYVNNAQPYATKEFGSKYGDLATAIKSGDKYTSIDRYLPEGAFSNGPSVDTLLSSGLPFFTGMYNASQGHNIYGGDLYDASGNKLSSGEDSIQALNQLVTSFIPGSQLIQKMELGGNTAAGSSTIWNPQAKPSTDEGWNLGTALDKALNPFYPTDLGRRAGVTVPKTKWNLNGKSSGWNLSKKSSGWNLNSKNSGWNLKGG